MFGRAYDCPMETREFQVPYPYDFSSYFILRFVTHAETLARSKHNRHGELRDHNELHEPRL